MPIAVKGSSVAESPTIRLIQELDSIARTGRHRTTSLVAIAPSEARTVTSPRCLQVRTPLADTGLASPFTRS